MVILPNGGGGNQPERLNAEGNSPSACSRGLSVSATPGTVCLQGKRLKDANVAAKEADFRVFQTHNGGVMIPRVSLRYTPGYEPLAPLGPSTFQVVLRLSAAVIVASKVSNLKG